MPAIACVDVGGTAIKAGVLRGGDLTATTSRPTPRGGDAGARVLDAVAELVAGFADGHDIGAVGVVVPGIVDSTQGVAVWSENLGWRDVPFRAALEVRTGLPVAFGHDVRAGALAEARLGAGVGWRDQFFMPVGTGIAAGLVLDGQLYDRDRPTGEIGHVDVGHDEPCVCGLRGCLEAISSASAIERRYAARAGTQVSAAVVSGLLGQGDPVATLVWEDAVRGLATAIGWTAAVLAPEVVVVGGGLSASGDLLFEPLRREVDERLSFHNRPEIVPAQLGDLSGCLGAGLLASDLIGVTA